MALLQKLNMDLPQVALMAVELEALSQKATNGTALLGDEFGKLQADSTKTIEFKQILGENMEDTDTVLVPKYQRLAQVAKELFDDMKGIEGSDEIIAQARAAANKKSNAGQKTRMPR